MTLIASLSIFIFMSQSSIAWWVYATSNGGIWNGSPTGFNEAQNSNIYVQSRMTFFAPNLTAISGASTAAKLMSKYSLNGSQ